MMPISNYPSLANSSSTKRPPDSPFSIGIITRSLPEMESEDPVSQARVTARAINTCAAAGAISLGLFYTDAKAGTIVSLGTEFWDVNGNGGIYAISFGGPNLTGSPSSMAFPIFAGKYSDGIGLSGSFKAVFDAVNTITGEKLPYPDEIPSFDLELYVFDAANIGTLSTSNHLPNQTVVLGSYSGPLSQFAPFGAASLPSSGIGLIYDVKFNTTESITGFVEGQDIFLGVAFRPTVDQSPANVFVTFSIAGYSNPNDVGSAFAYWAPGLGIGTPVPFSSYTGSAIAAFDIATGPKALPTNAVSDYGNTGLLLGVTALGVCAYRAFRGFLNKFE